MNIRKVLKIAGVIILYTGLVISLLITYIVHVMAKGENYYGIFNLRPTVYSQDYLEPDIKAGNILWLKQMTPELRLQISEGDIISFQDITEKMPRIYVEERMYAFVLEGQDENHIIKVGSKNQEFCSVMKTTLIEETAVYVWHSPRALTDFLITTQGGNLVVQAYIVIVGLITMAIIAVKFLDKSRKNRIKH